MLAIASLDPDVVFPEAKSPQMGVICTVVCCIGCSSSPTATHTLSRRALASTMAALGFRLLKEMSSIFKLPFDRRDCAICRAHSKGLERDDAAVRNKGLELSFFVETRHILASQQLSLIHI